MNIIIKACCILIIFFTLACEDPETTGNADTNTDTQSNSCGYQTFTGCYCDRKIYKNDYFCCFSNSGERQFYACTSLGGEEDDGYWEMIQDENIVCPGLGYPICPGSPYSR